MGYDELTEKLLKIKKNIEEKKTEKARLEGQLDKLMKDIKKDFEINTIREAKTKLRKLEAEVGKLKQDFEQGMEKLEKDYESITS